MGKFRVSFKRRNGSTKNASKAYIRRLEGLIKAEKQKVRAEKFEARRKEDEEAGVVR
jgi:hypothetical protein